MSDVLLADTVYFHFGTSNPSTGAAADADSLPVVTVEEDGVAMGYAPAVANVATGLYRVTVVASAGNGFEAGKRYSLYAAATVGGVTGRDGIAEFGVYVRGPDDLAAPGDAMALAAAAVNAIWDELTTEGRTASSYGQLLKDFIDAAISSRLATAGYTAPDNTSITTILGDTNDIQGRLPTGLVGGRIDASVGAMASDVLTAAALALDAANEIADNLLKRDIDQVEATAAVHSLASAVLKAVSRIRDNGAGALQVYRTDGTTIHVTQAVTVDGSLQPVKELGVGA